MENPEMADKNSAAIRDGHIEYWKKLCGLHYDTVELVAEIGSSMERKERFEVKMLCDELLCHKIDESILKCRDMAKESDGNVSGMWSRIMNILENYRETLPENDSQIASIVYNLSGESERKSLAQGNVPAQCTNAAIILSGRRLGFLLERIEHILVTVAKAME
jgi:hypothetical protein